MSCSLVSVDSWDSAQSNRICEYFTPPLQYLQNWKSNNKQPQQQQTQHSFYTMVTVATVSESPTGGGGEEEEAHGTTQEEVGNDEESDHGTVQEEVNRRNKKDKKRRKKKKVRLMSFSGQTDAERRELRGKFRRLNKDIEMDVPTVASSAAARASSGSRGDDERRGDEKMSDKILSGWRNENNLLGGYVRYTREAVLDSENVELITSKAAREAEKIIQVSDNPS